MTKLSLNVAPDEILFNIFQDLAQRDLYECQKVCRSWYLAAHLLLSKEIHLKDNADVDSFLDSIENIPMFRDAVKKLELGQATDVTWIDSPHLERLFSHTLGIDTLFIYGSIMFDRTVKNAEMRQTVAGACPKLEKVSCISSGDETEQQFNHLLKDLSQTLTSVTLDEDDSLDFLSEFSNLEELDVSQTITLQNANPWLPIFRHPYTLQKLHGSFTELDPDNFAEKYLRLLTEEERTSVVQKMGKLKMLCIEEDTRFCPNTMRFIARYLTGLDTFNVFSGFWHDINSASFCGDFLDTVSRVRQANIDIFELDLSGCVQAVLKKAFQSPSPTVQCIKQELELEYDAFNEYDRTGLAIRSTPTNTRQIERSVTFKSTREWAILDDLDTALQSNTINAFRFTLMRESFPTYFSTIERMLDKLPMVQKVALSLVDSDSVDNSTKQYSQVSHLALNSPYGLHQREMFTACTNMFPGIRYLRLNYFSGLLEDNVFTIPLDNLNLERLYLDVSPVILAASEISETYLESHFILAVHTIDKDQHHLFKVSLDYLRVTRIDSPEEEDLLRINVSVRDLEYINLYLYIDIITGNSFFRNKYIDSCAEDIMEAKISLINHAEL